MTRALLVFELSSGSNERAAEAVAEGLSTGWRREWCRYP